MLKNYTSTVPVSRSVQHIEDQLVSHGAKNIMKMYDERKRLDAICFIVPIPGKGDVPFRLPTNVTACEKVLRAAVKRRTDERDAKIREQAERTSWKLESDWVDIQMAKIELQQINMLQVFLAYTYDPASNTTFYQRIEANGFKLLENK
jgi:hypothetical protein